MDAAHSSSADSPFARMLEDRIARGAGRSERPGRDSRTDDVGRPTWDWLNAAAPDAGAWVDPAGAARYAGSVDARGPRSRVGSEGRRRRDPLAGLDPAGCLAMGFFHDLGEDDLHAGSSDTELKRAYRRLARRLHPDAGPNAHGAVRPSSRSFIELHRHYQTLAARLAA